MSFTPNGASSRGLQLKGRETRLPDLQCLMTVALRSTDLRVRLRIAFCTS